MTTRQFQALELSIDQLVTSPINVRRDVGDISELADSIREQGILEPLVVRPSSDGKYEVFIGSRRLAAARQVGLSLVPVVVQDISDAEAIVRSLVENLQRGDLSLEDRVEAYKRLQELDSTEFGDTRNLARVTGRAHQKIVQEFQAYDALIRLRPSGIQVATRMPPSAPERRTGEAIPETHATMLEQAMTAVRGKVAEDRFQSTYTELAKTIAPLERDKAQRVLDYFKMYPEKPVPEVASMALSTVQREVTLPAETARRLEELGERTGQRNWGELITQLVEAPPPVEETKETPVQQELSLSPEEVASLEAKPIAPEYQPLELPEDPMSVQLKNKVIWNLVHYAVKADFYTIGYTGRDIGQFIEILKVVGVSTVVDIRHTPVSRYKPEFSRDNLKNHLEENGFRYVHRGDLGVPREVRSRAIGQTNRDMIWDWYDENVLPRVRNGAFSEIMESFKPPLAFMCTELDPKACHRHRIFITLEESGLRGYDL